jgi:hypothetical protein
VPLWEQVARSPVAPVAPAPPIALARQVAYRMGQAPAPPAAPGFTILGPAPVPEVPFVWRTRPPVASPMAVDDAPPAGPRVSLPPGAAVQPPPVAGSGTALPAPAPTSPVQRVPAATGSTVASGAPALSTAPPSSIQVGYTPGPALVPAASLVTAPVLGPLAPLPRAAASPPAAAAPPVPVPTRWDQDLVWRVRPAPVREEAAHDEPAPRWSPVAAPVRIDTPTPTPVAMAGAPEPAVVLPRSPVSAPVATAPPTVEAAQHVVRLAYTPPPPPAPLWTGPAANLATELNRDLVAPGDLLARPARPWDQEPVAVAPQVVEAAASAPPSSDVPPLSMPLAAPARAATSPEAASGAADLPVAANPGLFSRLVDRVSTAIPLPEPIRLALESLAARPAARPSVPPAEAAPVPPPALSSAPAVEFPVAAPPSAPATMDSSQVPAAPAASGGPL